MIVTTYADYDINVIYQPTASYPNGYETETPYDYIYWVKMRQSYTNQSTGQIEVSHYSIIWSRNPFQLKPVSGGYQLYSVNNGFQYQSLATSTGTWGQRQYFNPYSYYIGEKLSEFYHIVGTGQDIANETGQVVITPYNGSNTQQGEIKFLLPHEDGFSDNSNVFAFWTYVKIPIKADEKISDFNISITGGVSGTGETLKWDARKVGENAEIYFNFDRIVNPGENNITVTITTPSGVTAEATRKVFYFEDFIDEDLDGLDDRTGQTNVPKYEPIQDNTPDGTILGYIRWAFENIMNIFTGLVDVIQSLFTNTGRMATLMQDFMSFLPWQIRNMLLVGVTVTIILKIMKR